MIKDLKIQIGQSTQQLKETSMKSLFFLNFCKDFESLIRNSLSRSPEIRQFIELSQQYKISGMDLRLEQIEKLTLENIKLVESISDSDIKPIVLSASVSLMMNEGKIDYDKKGKLVKISHPETQAIQKDKMMEIRELKQEMKNLKRKLDYQASGEDSETENYLKDRIDELVNELEELQRLKENSEAELTDKFECEEEIKKEVQQENYEVKL